MRVVWPSTGQGEYVGLLPGPSSHQLVASKSSTFHCCWWLLAVIDDNAMMQRTRKLPYLTRKTKNLSGMRRSQQSDTASLAEFWSLWFSQLPVSSILVKQTIRRGNWERHIVDKEKSKEATNTFTHQLFVRTLWVKLQVTGIATVKDIPYQWYGGWEEFNFRPMNCPSPLKSTNTMCILPGIASICIAEIAAMHRYEKSGALTGLQRAWNVSNRRSFLVAPEIEEELRRSFNWSSMCMKTLTWRHCFRLSYRGPEDKHKYWTTLEMWEMQRMLKAAVDDKGVEYHSWRRSSLHGPNWDSSEMSFKKKLQLSNWLLLPERFHPSHGYKE